jgi:aspartyl-tRNA(Asn)/glutamyl-tRNA(Gln) amidotransferase subunit A
MSQLNLPDRIVDQLRANLRAAGISAAESDLQGILEKGFLSRLPTVEQILEGAAADSTPDYLGGWSTPTPSPTNGAGEPASPSLPSQRERGPGDAGPYATLAQVAGLIRAHQLSPVELLEQTLERIARRDPALNAYQLVLAERARAAAAQAEREIAGGDYRGPLHGIPIAVKDLLDLAGTPTTAGSKILADHVAGADSTAVERLEQAGAVIVGKTRLSEFAYSPGSNNAHYGSTRNPWSADHDTGGSSSGSTAAVAAGLAYAALGSDTGGSIRIPASLCGVVGLKPTYGRVSRYGLIAFASSLDQIGPFTRTVEDTAIVLSAIAGHDKCDSTSLDAPVPNYAAALHKEPNLKGMRLALPREYFSVEGMEPSVDGAVKVAIEQLEKLGASFEEVSLPHTQYGLATYYLIAPAECSANLARYDGVKYSSSIRDSGATLWDVYEKTRGQCFGREVKRRIILGTYALSSGYYDAYYLKAQKVRTLIKRDFDQVFERFDAVVTPTSPNAAFELGAKTQDPLAMYLNDLFTIPTSLAGLPGISVPAGLANGLPVGLQVIGKALDEQTVLRVAHAYEQATEWHKQRSPVAQQ